MTAQHATDEPAVAGASAGRDETTPPGSDEEARRPGHRRAAVVVTVLVLAAAGTAAAILVYRDGEAPPATGQEKALASAPIKRGEVTDTDSVDGKLQYGDVRSIPSSADGVVTWTPTAGAIVTRGKALLRVNADPVILMYGSVPLYRTLEPGLEGRDVKQLETNLQALGYADDFTVDDEYTWATADAVEQWQDDLGLPETGTVDSSQVVFQPREVRVSEVKVAKGAKTSSGSAALTVTSTQAIVHVDLEAARQNLVTRNQDVTVTLPGGSTAKGKVTSLGTVAETDQDGNATIGLDISVSTKEVGRIDQLPVTVELVSERATGVLSVPIEALLGLREGGFGVEVLKEDGTTEIIQVKTGVYGGGRVEITGTGLQEGMKVGVPAS